MQHYILLTIFTSGYIGFALSSWALFVLLLFSMENKVVDKKIAKYIHITLGICALSVTIISAGSLLLRLSNDN